MLEMINRDDKGRFIKGNKINLGRFHSKETKKKIGLKSKERKWSEESKDKLRKYHKTHINKGWFKKGRIVSEQERKKISERLKKNNYFKGKTYEELYGIKKAKEIKKKIDRTKYRKILTKELLKKEYIIKKRAINEISKELNIPLRVIYNYMERLNIPRTKMYSKEHFEKILRGVMKRPTSFEKKIIDLCKKHNFSFKYVGDGQVFIGFKNPDFIETNGKKLLIETYCKIWHPNNYEKKRNKIFSKYGYKTLFLNDNDLLNKNWEQICLNKIKKFINGSECYG